MRNNKPFYDEKIAIKGFEKLPVESDCSTIKPEITIESACVHAKIGTSFHHTLVRPGWIGRWATIVVAF